MTIENNSFSVLGVFIVNNVTVYAGEITLFLTAVFQLPKPPVICTIEKTASNSGMLVAVGRGVREPVKVWPNCI